MTERPNVPVTIKQATRIVEMPRGRELDPPGRPKLTPCVTCPHRVANFNGTTGHGERWDVAFRTETRDKFWTGELNPEHPENALRHGGVNRCHQTQTHPCAGAVVLQQRELLRLHDHGYQAQPGRYALSREGIRRIAARLLNGGERCDPRKVPVWRLRIMKRRDVLKLAHPAIADAAIGHEALDPPAPGEFD